MASHRLERNWSRRYALRMAGGSLMAGALGAGYLATRARADVPASSRFDLTKPSPDFYRHKKLHCTTVQQSLSFDTANQRLFTMQRRDGTDSALGHLCVTQLDLAGARVGHMHLNGFGHGVAFAAQGVGTATYLWTEVEANGNGYGRRLARFKFTNGTTLTSGSAELTKLTPVPDASEHTCSIDPVTGRLAVRYHRSGAKHLALYDLGDAERGDFGSPLVDFPQPSIPGTMQGYAVYGQYAYFMVGNAYSDANPAPGNTYLTTVDLNTAGKAQGPTLTKAGGTLVFREPEGLAIDRTSGGQVRLVMGFASGNAGDRRSNLFYKHELV